MDKLRKILREEIKKSFPTIENDILLDRLVNAIIPNDDDLLIKLLVTGLLNLLDDKLSEFLGITQKSKDLFKNEGTKSVKGTLVEIRKDGLIIHIEQLNQKLMIKFRKTEQTMDPNIFNVLLNVKVIVEFYVQDDQMYLESLIGAVDKSPKYTNESGMVS